MNIEKTLESIGFSANEIKVFLVLNDYGSNKAGRISKLAKIDRSSSYNALKSLIEKGLASYVSIGKVKWFQGTGPKRLLDFIKEQEDDIKQIIPLLDARHKAGKIEGQVRLFKGIKGINSPHIYYTCRKKVGSYCECCLEKLKKKRNQKSKSSKKNLTQKVETESCDLFDLFDNYGLYGDNFFGPT